MNTVVEGKMLGDYIAAEVKKHHVEPGEEERLRALTRDDWLWRLRLVAALETGCRIGELLTVQFKQLRWDLNELHLSNRTTKGLRTRYVPLSQELRAMLDLRRYDPDGQQFGPDAYVFGNEVGERLKNYQKRGRRFDSARSATDRTGDRTADSFLLSRAAREIESAHARSPARSW